MFSVSNADCNYESSPIDSVCGMANMLRKHEQAVFGPSSEEIKECERIIIDLKQETKLAEAINTVTSMTRRSYDDGSLTNLASDAENALEVVSGILMNRKTVLITQYKGIDQYLIAKSKKVEIRKITDQVCNILDNAYYELMELRQSILSSKGLAPAFRASRDNMNAVIKAAQSNNVKDDTDFVEV